MVIEGRHWIENILLPVMSEAGRARPGLFFSTVFGKGSEVSRRNAWYKHSEIGEEELNSFTSPTRCAVCAYAHKHDNIAAYRGTSPIGKCFFPRTTVGP